MDLKKNIGIQISNIREAKGISRVELAKAAKVTPASITNIENGRYAVGMTVLERITRALGCTVVIV